MDGQEIASPQDLAGAMNLHQVGEEITLTIFRGKKRMEVKVKVNDAMTPQAQTGRDT